MGEAEYKWETNANRKTWMIESKTYSNLNSDTGYSKAWVAKHCVQQCILSSYSTASEIWEALNPKQETEITHINQPDHKSYS